MLYIPSQYVQGYVHTRNQSILCQSPVCLFRTELVGRELIRKGELIGIGAFIEKMALDRKGPLIGFRRNLKAPTRKSTEK